MRFAGLLFVLAMTGVVAAQQPSSASSSSAPPNPPATQVAPPASSAAAQPASSSPATASPSQSPASLDTARPGSTPADTTAAQKTPDAPKDGILTPEMLMPTKREQAEAKRQFQAGLKLESKGNLDAAFDKYSSASELDSRNVSYVTAREFARQELAMKALKDGNKAMLSGNEIVAMASFRRALEYDPTNDYALQRLQDAIPEDQHPAHAFTVEEESRPVELQPTAPVQDFHYRGDSRSLLTQVTKAYGITAEFDDSVKQQHVHFDIQGVNFSTAMEAACSVTKTFWVPLSAKQILLLADTTENRRNFQRLGLRTFYVPELSDQELTEVVNFLRVLLNIRFVSQDKEKSAIIVRAELPLLEAAEHVIKALTTGRPEVMLDIRIYSVSTSMARALGTALPTQFTLFNISPALLAGLGASASNAINQLISSGGINQANSQAISALLGQLQSSSAGSILTTPFITFGGGYTLFGLNAGGVGLTPTFSLNTSDIRELDHVMLRASQNGAAVMKIGERYPIVNATFAPIYNTAAISRVLGNQSYIAPFPSFNFEDLGLNLKATPYIHDNSDVTMKLELQIRSLGTTNVNGIPIINNREYTGVITARSGESSVITGMITLDDARSMNGYPFLARVPGLTYASSVRNANVADDELLVVITPHIMRLPERETFAVQLPSDH